MIPSMSEPKNRTGYGDDTKANEIASREKPQRWVVVGDVVLVRTAMVVRCKTQMYAQLIFKERLPERGRDVGTILAVPFDRMGAREREFFDEYSPSFGIPDWIRESWKANRFGTKRDVARKA